MTCSFATTWPCFISQCGSPCDVFTRCAPTASTHSGSIFATFRANSFCVSTSSAAITQRALPDEPELFRARADPDRNDPGAFRSHVRRVHVGAVGHRERDPLAS